MRFVSTKILKRVLLAIGLIGAASALGGCHRFHRAPPEEKAQMIRKMAKSKLDLNEEQLVKFDALSVELVALANEMKQHRQQNKELLIGAFEKNSLSAQDLQNAYKQRQAIIDARVPEITSKIAELSSVLNSEQRQEIVEFVRDHLDHDEK